MSGHTTKGLSIHLFRCGGENALGGRAAIAKHLHHDLQHRVAGRMFDGLVCCRVHPRVLVGGRVD
eukprot:scaffold490481_cov13-Prasinocladus_malaysianus.AAC.1